jgi:cytoskeletal protein CcmA (bactofilin family)
MSFWNKIDKPFSDAPATPGEPLRPAPAAAAPPPATVAAVQPPAAPPAPVPAPAPAAVAPAPAPASSAPAPAPSDLRLGRGVRLEGKLSFSGTVRIDATFEGEIVTDGVLVVGEAAKVDAEIACGTVIVEGEINGNVIASQAVELHATARLRGDVETPAFAIERGAIFEGASKRPGGSSSSDRRAGKHAASQQH